MSHTHTNTNETVSLGQSLWPSQPPMACTVIRRRLGPHYSPFLPSPLILPRPLPHGLDTLNLTAVGIVFQVASHIAQKAKQEPSKVGCSKDMGVFGATRGRTRAQPSKGLESQRTSPPSICLEPPLALQLPHAPDNQRELIPTLHAQYRCH